MKNKLFRSLTTGQERKYVHENIEIMKINFDPFESIS